MILFELLYFVILSLSVSYMWSYASIFAPVRKFVAKIPYVRVPMLCPDCSSFWMGIFVSFLYNPIVLMISVPLLTNIFCGLVTHFFASFLYKIKNSIEISSMSKVKSQQTTSSIEFVN
jgi:hypothetical protein